ncbi:hypothetical protein MXD62_11300, partial [Frankia sp. Mgl5]|nr:hypothetical protein [Frankia sp. Mgl5]
ATACYRRVDQIAQGIAAHRTTEDTRGGNESTARDHRRGLLQSLDSDADRVGVDARDPRQAGCQVVLEILDAATDRDGHQVVAPACGAHDARVMTALGDSFLDGLHLCLLVAAVLTLIAAVVALVMLGRPSPASIGTAQRTGPGSEPVRDTVPSARP